MRSRVGSHVQQMMPQACVQTFAKVGTFVWPRRTEVGGAAPQTAFGGYALPPNYPPRQWRRALYAVARLAKNTERTEQVFEIIQALSGGNLERTFRRFIRDPEGSQLLTERPDLLRVLADREYLHSLPAGSLGREYLRFMEEGELMAEGLIAAQDTARAFTDERIVLDRDRQYVADRLRDMHDLWHVLTGYGRDDSGEIANLWFSVGQFGNPGLAFIAFLGCLDGLGQPGWIPYLYRAWRRGKRARQLVTCRIEQLLPRSLTEAREVLGVESPEHVHPEGIRCGNRRDRRLGSEPHLT